MPSSDQTNNDAPRIYTIHSQKGGVGKTSIAIAIAGIAAIWYGMNALIIDADLTGTSLVDLPGWYEGTRCRYINELILARPGDFLKYTPITSHRLEKKFCHNMRLFYHELPSQKHNIRYMTASPVFEDIRKIVPLISQEDNLHFFRHRLEDIIVTAIADQFDVIVIDHPPGLYGISKASLDIVLKQITTSQLKRKQGGGSETRLDKLYRMIKRGRDEVSIAAQAFLITTPDPPDYRALFPFFYSILKEQKEFKLSEQFWPVDIIVNKRRGKKEARPDPVTLPREISGNLTNFPDNREVGEDLIDAFLARARKFGALACPDVEDFSMTEIMLTIESTKGDTRQEYVGMRGWIKQIAKSVALYKVVQPASSGIEQTNAQDTFDR